MTAKVYQSYRVLKTVLGQLDASHELSELGLRHLVEASRSEASFESYTASAAERLGLRVRVNNPRNAHRILALSGIGTVHSTYECFIVAFVAEAERFGLFKIDAGKKPANTSKHDYYLAALRMESARLSGKCFDLLQNTLEHFRLIRNSHVHQSRSQINVIEKLRTKMIESNEWTNIFTQRPIPSHYNAVGYPDFLLFTHAVRLMARHISEAFLPSDLVLLKHADFTQFRQRIPTPSRKSEELFLQDRFALDKPTIGRLLNLCHE